jgi:multidrug transporter EmrE-like cation transporter
MSERLTAILIILLVAALCAACDWLLKRASLCSQPFSSPAFWAGLAGYTVSAFAWVFILRWMKLSTIGAIYSVCLIVLLALIGVVFFQEKLNREEICGLVLACVSIFLLVRFA